MVFEANTYANCPKCGETFIHNKVNGMSLLQATGEIEARKRMRSRLSLDSLERMVKDSGSLAFVGVKKVILDGYNDLARDIYTIIGIGQEVE